MVVKWTLFSQDLGSSWAFDDPVHLLKCWGLHLESCPHTIKGCFQQAPPFHFTSYQRCHRSEGLDPPSSRNQMLRYLPPCTATNTEKKIRTASPHSGPPCLGFQRDISSAQIAGCIAVFTLTIAPVADHTSCFSYPFIIHIVSSPHLTYIPILFFSHFFHLFCAKTGARIQKNNG
jgi:hypothetical protein